jgi:hypothetical protein
MKTIRPILFLLLLGLPRDFYAQGFINLNFESAVIVTNGSSGIPVVVASSAIPGWTPTGYLGPNYILSNSASTGSSSVSILGTNGFRGWRNYSRWACFDKTDREVESFG